MSSSTALFEAELDQVVEEDEDFYDNDDTEDDEES